MSESWKNRFWSLLLVCTFAFVLSVCNKALENEDKSSSSSGIAYADFKPSDVSHIMVCGSSHAYPETNSGAYYYTKCDASNNDSSIEATKSLNDDSGRGTDQVYVISLDAIASNGWKFCGTSNNQYRFCK